MWEFFNFLLIWFIITSDPDTVPRGADIMKYWVCRKHEDQVLFSDDDLGEAPKAKRLSILPMLSDTPRECPECGIYYYRKECAEKER